MIEDKHADIRDLVNRGTFRAAFRIDLPDGANVFTAICDLAMKTDKAKEKRH